MNREIKFRVYDEDLKRKPDAVYAFGVEGTSLDGLGVFPTVFYEDTENDILAAAVPGSGECRGMSGLILNTSEDGKSRIQLRAEGHTVLLTQAEMAELFSTALK